MCTKNIEYATNTTFLYPRCERARLSGYALCLPDRPHFVFFSAPPLFPLFRCSRPWVLWSLALCGCSPPPSSFLFCFSFLFPFLSPLMFAGSRPSVPLALAPFGWDSFSSLLRGLSLDVCVVRWCCAPPPPAAPGVLRCPASCCVVPRFGVGFFLWFAVFFSVFVCRAVLVCGCLAVGCAVLLCCWFCHWHSPVGTGCAVSVGAVRCPAMPCCVVRCFVVCGAVVRCCVLWSFLWCCVVSWCAVSSGCLVRCVVLPCVGSVGLSCSVNHPPRPVLVPLLSGLLLLPGPLWWPIVLLCAGVRCCVVLLSCLRALCCCQRSFLLCGA